MSVQKKQTKINGAKRQHDNLSKPLDNGGLDASLQSGASIALGDVQKRYKEEMMRYRMQNNRSAHGDDLQAA